MQRIRDEIGYYRNEVKAYLSIRDGGFCQCCGLSESELSSPLEIDHIKPVTKAGGNIASNLQLLCKRCNLEKGVQEIDYRGSFGAPAMPTLLEKFRFKDRFQCDYCGKWCYNFRENNSHHLVYKNDKHGAHDFKLVHQGCMLVLDSIDKHNSNQSLDTHTTAASFLLHWLWFIYFDTDQQHDKASLMRIINRLIECPE